MPFLDDAILLWTWHCYWNPQGLAHSPVVGPFLREKLTMLPGMQVFLKNIWKVKTWNQLEVFAGPKGELLCQNGLCEGWIAVIASNLLSNIITQVVDTLDMEDLGDKAVLCRYLAWAARIIVYFPFSDAGNPRNSRIAMGPMRSTTASLETMWGLWSSRRQPRPPQILVL